MKFSVEFETFYFFSIKFKKIKKKSLSDLKESKILLSRDDPSSFPLQTQSTKDDTPAVSKELK